MATRIRASLQEALRSCYPDDVLRELAEKMEVQQRTRKVSVTALFWTLLLGFGTGVQRSIAELHREFQQATGRSIVRSSFYDRFTPRWTAFLRAVLNWATSAHGEPTEKLQGRLAGFRDLVVTDSTVLRLHDLLQGAYKACRTNVGCAAAKLHLVMSVTGMGPLSVRITGERSADCRNFKVGKWVVNRLLLFDLGYFSYHLFDCIARNRGFFVTRAKSTINPRIVAVNRRWRGRSRSLVGQRLQDVLGTLRRGILDVMVEVEFKRRRYRDKQSSGVKVFRLVGILNQDTGEYHLYMTNIPADRLDAEDIARVYRARWEVELIFKELKSHYQLDRLPSTKAHIVEALIYTAILTLIVSRRILVALRRLRGVGANRTPERRWTISFHSCAARLLDLLLDPSAAPASWRRLEGFLTREFLDPNRSRSRNLSVAWS